MKDARRIPQLFLVGTLFAPLILSVGCGSGGEAPDPQTGLDRTPLVDAETAERYDAGEEEARADGSIGGILAGTVASRPWELESVSRTGNAMFTLRADPNAGNHVIMFFFFFPEEGETLEGSTITQALGDDVFGPHIHVHYRDAETGESRVGLVTENYELDVTFGDRRDGGSAPSTMRFIVPELDLDIAGTFELPPQ